MDKESTAKVFITNKSYHDYSGAERFGELIFITTGQQRYFSVNQHVRMWNEALQHSEPTDFIILSSLNILCSIGCALFALKHGRLNLLLYRKDSKKQRGKYVARELILHDVVDPKAPWLAEVMKEQDDDSEWIDQAADESPGGEC